MFVDYFLRRNHNPLNTTEFLQRSESMDKRTNSRNEFASFRTTDRSRENSLENEMNPEDKLRVDCAIRFVIEKLYKSIQTHFDVRYISIYNILSSYLYVMFLALEYSEDIRRT